jgi:hypothetical protein
VGIACDFWVLFQSQANSRGQHNLDKTGKDLILLSPFMYYTGSEVTFLVQAHYTFSMVNAQVPYRFLGVIQVAVLIVSLECHYIKRTIALLNLPYHTFVFSKGC